MSGNEFKSGLFGCFSNVGLCVITYIAPCYTFGRNMEKLGESCLICGLAYLLGPVSLALHLVARGRIRTAANIEGDLTNDLLVVWCCPCCALIQESVELQQPGFNYVERA